MDEDLFALGAAIKAARAERGLTQQAVGQAAGIDGSTISLWERGRHRPSAAELRRLARTLHASPDEWLRLAGYVDDQGEWRVRDGRPSDAEQAVRESLLAGPWSPELVEPILKLLKLCDPSETDASRDAWLKRVEAAWEFAEQVPAAYEGKPYSPESYRFRLRERFWQHLSGEVDRAPQFESSTDIVDLRP
jgi:transcriptional regulator with XRE-family HTH domain